MSTSINRIVYIVLIAIVGISVIMIGWYYLGGVVPETEGTLVEEKNATWPYLTWALILVITASVITLGFSVYYIATNPKAIKNFVTILVIAFVLVGISYLLSSGEQVSDQVKLTVGALKRIDVGLISTFILLCVAFVGIIFSEVYKALQ
jgi:hypothetical protein